MESNLREQIIKIMKEKSSVKQDIFQETLNAFRTLKDTARAEAENLKRELFNIDKRVTVEFRDRSDFMFELKVAGDLLVFQMHTNIFEFDNAHYIKKAPYVAKNEMLSFCGMISVYNFLADSFKYYRINDVGYLMARIFVNRESSYFVESKNRKITMSHSDFGKQKINSEMSLNLLETIILATLEFDLFTPPYDTQREITVSEVNDTSSKISIQTGKRLGFKFQFEDEKGIR
jgi:CRISPR/Cas system CMR subunit Cmr6 (Cas7 group RAMP superfamily)